MLNGEPRPAGISTVAFDASLASSSPRPSHLHQNNPSLMYDLVLLCPQDNASVPACNNSFSISYSFPPRFASKFACGTTVWLIMKKERIPPPVA